MEYNEKTAQEIAEKFGLSGKTVITWKHRGSIPDKYASLKGPGNLERVSEKEIKKLGAVFSSKKINLAKFAENSGVKIHVISDLIRKKRTLSKIDYVKIKTYLNTLRLECKQIVEKCNNTDNDDSRIKLINGLITDYKEFVVLHFLENKKFIDLRNNKKVVFSTIEVNNAVDKVSIFILETRL